MSKLFIKRDNKLVAVLLIDKSDEMFSLYIRQSDPELFDGKTGTINDFKFREFIKSIKLHKDLMELENVWNDENIIPFEYKFMYYVNGVKGLTCTSEWR